MKKKQIIRLNESQLKNIIRKAVNEIAGDIEDAEYEEIPSQEIQRSQQEPESVEVEDLGTGEQSYEQEFLRKLREIPQVLLKLKKDMAEAVNEFNGEVIKDEDDIIHVQKCAFKFNANCDMKGYNTFGMLYLKLTDGNGNPLGYCEDTLQDNIRWQFSKLLRKKNNILDADDFDFHPQQGVMEIQITDSTGIIELMIDSKNNTFNW